MHDVFFDSALYTNSKWIICGVFFFFGFSKLWEPSHTPSDSWALPAQPQEKSCLHSSGVYRWNWIHTRQLLQWAMQFTAECLQWESLRKDRKATECLLRSPPCPRRCPWLSHSHVFGCWGKKWICCHNGALLSIPVLWFAFEIWLLLK